LFLQVNNHRHERLLPTTADEFIPQLLTPDDGRIITFVVSVRRIGLEEWWPPQAAAVPLCLLPPGLEADPGPGQRRCAGAT
jgi:hypothetical protein